MSGCAPSSEIAWLEVSLTVNGELAEAVADVFARIAPGGVVTEQAVTYTEVEDEGTSVGPVTVRAYLPVDSTLEERRGKLEEALGYLSMIQPLPPPHFAPLANQNWMEAWKQHYRPIPIGQRLMIVPAWMDSPAGERIPIRIDPGMAFGTGTHPTTQLCLELLEILGLAAEPPTRVIDVGCGSGILAIAALKMGAFLALGVDIEELAVKAARENARLNGIPEEKLLLGLGSVGEILAGSFPLRDAPLVFVNILAPVIMRLFEDGLARLLTPAGKLILSGILESQAEEVLAAARSQGLALVERRQLADWVALLLIS